MKVAKNQWRRGMVAYGITYYTTRVVLIVASAIVASGRNLADSPFHNLWYYVPALSLLVAIVTALDTWLKPQQKWQGFMESRDALADLFVRIDGGLPLDEARERFFQLRQRHREVNVF
ncbi:hypothetical protein R6V09_10310 [Streptomyces sp. W16]|uniref:hypothetical protein n=1 Tax=Streptomyces sp. W16 TaxID=3076631 RepID=UPI00295B842C|nr:hypothetical protein [Streptomyces sp. W16]MDV9170524.1 hypothetical protein [Streptomyces sp. W16]